MPQPPQGTHTRTWKQDGAGNFLQSSFPITYKHKAFFLCGTPYLVHGLLHKYFTQEPIMSDSHSHSKFQGAGEGPKVIQQDSKVNGTRQKRSRRGLGASPCCVRGCWDRRWQERRLLPPLSFSATLHFFRLTAHACTAASQALCGKGLVLFISADLTLMGSPRS